MNTRRMVTSATGVCAILLATASVAWACGTFSGADMTLKNATGPLQGKNYTECLPSTMVSIPHTCVRPVVVEGKNFENSTDIRTITQVSLYWLDEPFYAAGLGGPDGLAERTEAAVCESLGVFLTTATVTNKSFVATVNIPPTNLTTANGTPRAPFYYGLNAVCATWEHVSGGVPHRGSIGNGYNIYPI